MGGKSKSKLKALFPLRKMVLKADSAPECDLESAEDMVSPNISIPATPSPRIPIELLLKIMSFCSDSRSTLVKLALVNRQISGIALQYIWYNLELGKSPKHPFHHQQYLNISKKFKLNTLTHPSSSSSSLNATTALPSLEILQNSTRVINCYFNNYNYLLRFSSFNPKSKNDRSQFANVRTLKIHLDSIRGIPGKKGYSERIALSEDFIARNYAKKLPLNFTSIVFKGLPDPYYVQCWYGGWNEKGFRPYTLFDPQEPQEQRFSFDDDKDKDKNKNKIEDNSKKAKIMRGPSRVIFHLTDKHTDRLITHVQNTFNGAQFPNVRQLDIVFLTKKAALDLRNDFRIKQDFASFVADLMQLLDSKRKAWPKMRIRLINTGCFDPYWMGMYVYTLPTLNTASTAATATATTTTTTPMIAPVISTEEELELEEETKMLWFEDYLQKQARSRHYRILADAGTIEASWEGEGMDQVPAQQLISLRQYVREENREDEFDKGEIEHLR
ncbi:uncharacterized protein I303_101867 [Kwoniella dejecticola CBS 10117]|uniref:F-box domain-containing protein n=1 Tax=Kwoniella dejecticola CBS 10117 TaxID=1296121 RepID=A0A1A6ACJ9_9TREE|nr:uncharacterized protein I303_01997 [Kwoniella dejecticola CBS 10117]OBR87784.1 hypothetical protein I303_01997 [Kwoniella dejecticola CBS 10117]